MDFGSTPGVIATATVTGQAGILAASSLAEAWLGNVGTADHTDLEHSVLEAYGISVRAGNIIDATGFTITVVSTIQLTGQIAVNWVWN